MSPADRTLTIDALAEVAGDYDVLLCDLWGCFHNGVAPYPAAVSALQAFRAQGGVVVLLTNAPRPRDAVERHLRSMNAPQDAYDGIVSSGDSTRADIASGRWGRRATVIGPARDNPVWEGLPIEHAPIESAEFVLCTGLFDDEVETPADYADRLASAKARDLPFLCANPDVIVDRGEQRLFCAGALAEAYAALGGQVAFFGKPHAPIYTLALEEARRLHDARRGDDGRALASERILAIGDGIGTDVLGAEQAGLDCVFVSGGLAAAEVGDDPEHPDPALLAQYLVSHGRSPRYAIGRLR